MKSDTQFNLATACPRMQLGADGIWYAGEVGEISYPSEGNEACFEIEDNSFWFRHRNDSIREVVRNFPPKETGAIFES